MADHAALAQLWRGRALAGAGRHDAAEAAFRRAAAAAQATGRLVVALDAHTALGAICTAARQVEAATHHQTVAAEVANSIRRPAAEAIVPWR
jgi:hypothetical protein